MKWSVHMRGILARGGGGGGGIWTANQSLRKKSNQFVSNARKKEEGNYKALTALIWPMHKWLCNTRWYQTLWERKFQERSKQLRVENTIWSGTTHSGVFDWLRGVWYCDKILCNVTSQTKSFIGEIKDAKFPFDFQILRLTNNFLVN